MHAQRPPRIPVPARLPGAAPWPAAGGTPAPARAPLLTRRYELTWLSPSGGIEATSRIAPATPEFEETSAAFARGTLIAAEHGSVAIEDLQPGMQVQTAEGRMETVVWIGSISLFAPRLLPEVQPVTLTRITAEAFGMGRPMPDVVLGPRARLLLRDSRCRATVGAELAYAPARSFVDGISVIEVKPVAAVTMFHIALRRHATLRAAGLEVEAYHPGMPRGELADTQMAGAFLSLFPHLSSLAEFGPLAHARMTASEVLSMTA